MCIGGDEMADSAKLEQNKTEKPLGSKGRIALIGFFAGFFWGLIGWVSYYLNFTKIGPGLILQPWALGKWKTGVGGQLLGILVICMVSIAVAYLYNITLGKVRSLWVAIAFGLALWVVVFYILQPWIPHLQPVTKLGPNTISTTLCIYILYGLFLGYSVSFDRSELANNNTSKKK